MTIKPKHTPKPWMWTHKELNFKMKSKGYHDPRRPWWFCLQSLTDKFNEGLSPEHPKFDGNAGVVMSCRVKKSSEFYSGVLPNKADMRLIAAAPELLEALIGLCRQIEISDAVDPLGHKLEHLQSLVVAQAAIAKATN